MKTVAIFIFLFSMSVQAQTISELQKYDKVSPIEQPALSERQMVNPEDNYKTALEEQIEERQAQEVEQKQAQEKVQYLDTDFQFFQALVVPTEDDELDKVVKQNELARAAESQKISESNVKQEIGVSTPSALKMVEADRSQLILKRISANASSVKACFRQHKDKGIDGSQLTLAWEVDDNGKVLNASVKATDMTNKDIQDCIVKAVMAWDFVGLPKADKKSNIEYTYKFVSAERSTVSVTKPGNGAN